MTFLNCLNSPKFDFTQNRIGSRIIKYQQSQDITTYFESFWSIVSCQTLILTTLLLPKEVHKLSRQTVLTTLSRMSFNFSNTNNTGSITLDQSLPYIAPNALMAPYLIIGVWYLSLISLFFSNNVNCLLFPEEDSNALEMINRSAKCEPHPTIEVMMDHIVLNGKKLSTIKRLFPSHVIMHKCKGKLILDAKLKSYRVN